MVPRWMGRCVASMGPHRRGGDVDNESSRAITSSKIDGEFRRVRRLP